MSYCIIVLQILFQFNSMKDKLWAQFTSTERTWCLLKQRSCFLTKSIENFWETVQPEVMGLITIIIDE